MRLDSFLGIRNTVDIRKIPDNALSDAVNVDIDDSGAITQCNGYAVAKSLTSVSSAYSTPEQQCYVVDNGKLCRIDEYLQRIELADSTATQFCYSGLYMFTNDGLKVNNDIAESLIMPIPLQPTASVITGSLPAGEYSILTTFENGIESGTSDVLTVTLEDNQGIRIITETRNGYTTNVYVTEGNGEVFYWCGTTQVDLITTAQYQQPIRPNQLAANSFPLADVIEYHESSLYCAQYLPAMRKTVVWWSNPFEWHLFDMDSDYILLEGEVLGMRSTAQGLIIGTDINISVYADNALIPLANYGVVRGRPMAKRHDGLVLINSLRGICRFPEFENLTWKKCSFAPGDSCSTAFVDQDGTERFVILTDGGGTVYNKAF